MTDLTDIDALAAEYVLGTLDANERATVSVRRMHEPSLEAAIAKWENKLGPLIVLAPEIAPPASVLPRIERRLFDKARLEGADIASLAIWRQQARRWRQIAILASGLAASLMIWIGSREFLRQPPPEQFIGVFTQDDTLPKFYLTINLRTRELVVRPVGARRQDGKTYQLWIVSDQTGPAPHSLGLVEDDLGTTTKRLTDYDPAVLQRATFGVSLEQKGGSTTGLPSAGALHAKLLPVAH
jgi:anti-sigma-K factor RskA